MADRVIDFGLVKTRSLSGSDESSFSTPDSAMAEPAADHDLEKTTSRASHFSRKGNRELTKVTTAKDWSGPDDPGNPQNWSGRKKLFHTIVPALQCFTVTFGSSVYTPSVRSVQEHFGVSLEAAILPLSLYVLGLGFGPTIGAPISEMYGRRVTYVLFFLPSLLFTLGAGLSQNFATFLVCRFLAGTLGSGCLAVGAGTQSDLFAPLDRAAASAMFLLAPFLGPAMGPLVGGFADQNKGWRWTQWPILMIGGLSYLITLPSKETYKKIILQKRAREYGLPPPPNPLPKSIGGRVKFILTVTLFRPIQMLLTEPIVGFMSTYTAFNFAVLFAFFAAFPLVFSSHAAPKIVIYHFSTGIGGLTFLGIGVGCFVGTAIFIAIDRLYYRKQTLLLRARGIMTPLPPEARLPGAMIGSTFLPVSLFWFAWSAKPEIHWIVPLISTVFFGAGNMLVFTSTVTYIIDTYGPLLGASAAAANGIYRYVLGAVFPLFTVQMYVALGVGWATSLLAFVTVALLPIPWVLWRWGDRIRARSNFAMNVDGGAAAAAKVEEKPKGENTPTEPESVDTPIAAVAVEGKGIV